MYLTKLAGLVIANTDLDARALLAPLLHRLPVQKGGKQSKELGMHVCKEVGR